MIFPSKVYSGNWRRVQLIFRRNNLGFVWVTGHWTSRTLSARCLRGFMGVHKTSSHVFFGPGEDEPVPRLVLWAAPWERGPRSTVNVRSDPDDSQAGQAVISWIHYSHGQHFEIQLKAGAGQFGNHMNVSLLLCRWCGHVGFIESGPPMCTGTVCSQVWGSLVENQQLKVQSHGSRPWIAGLASTSRWRDPALSGGVQVSLVLVEEWGEHGTVAAFVCCCYVAAP